MMVNCFCQRSFAKLDRINQVFSWEPLRCHDVVDVGWSKIADLTIQEGKLLGCSYNKSSVGIWVVDLSVSVSHVNISVDLDW